MENQPSAVDSSLNAQNHHKMLETPQEILRINMSNLFRPHYDPDNMKQCPAVTNTPGLVQTLMYLGDEDSIGKSHYLAFQLNLEAAQGKDLSSEEARSVHFLGCISSLFCGISLDTIEDMKNSGVAIEIVRAPSSAGIAVPDMLLSPVKCMAILGYLVLVLFKTVTQTNFWTWSEKRLRALYAVAGHCFKDEVELVVFNDLTHAQSFRALVGQNHGLRVRILNMVLGLRNRPTPFGAACAYVSQILSWTDMTTFNLIYETMVVTNSPILRSPEVASEVLNLRNAAEKILEYPQPQYFRILQTPAETQFMKNSNFPKLVALAKAIKGSTEEDINQFVGSQISTTTGPLANLLAEHRLAMASSITDESFLDTIRFLTDIDESDSATSAD